VPAYKTSFFKRFWAFGVNFVQIRTAKAGFFVQLAALVTANRLKR
jgi:hypothetical protein